MQIPMSACFGSPIISYFRLDQCSLRRPIAAANGKRFCLEYPIGFMPFLSLESVSLTLFLFLFNIKLALASLAIFIASVLAWLADFLLHQLGLFVLTEIGRVARPGKNAVQHAYSASHTIFYNTVAMAGFLVALITVPPVYLTVRKYVTPYRQKLMRKVKDWEVVRFVRGTSIYRWEEHLAGCR